MIKSMRAVIHAGWRIGLVTAAVVAAAAPANAQFSTQMGIGTQKPHIEFNGSDQSRVALDAAGNLTIAAGATSVTNVLGEKLVIVTVWNGPRDLDAGGGCGSYNVNGEFWFYAEDANGANPKCYSDLQPGVTTTPPHVWGGFNIQTRVDAGGNMLGGTPAGAVDACGVLNGDDLCVKGVALRCMSAADLNGCFSQGFNAVWRIVQGPGILLTGKMKVNLGTQVFASMRRDAIGNTTGKDLFEFVFQVSGGLLEPWYSPASLSDSRKFVVVQAAGLPNNQPQLNPVSLFADFGTPFSEVVEGAVDSAKWSFMLPPPDPCNGRISGSVTDYFNALNGIPGSEVQLTGQPNLIPASNGAYSSANNLCAGTYTVTALPPAGYTVYGAGSQTVTIGTSVDGTQNNAVSGVNFRMYAAAVNSAAYTTFVQAGWGTKPRANNAGALLATYFSFVYPGGELVIGDPLKFTITETGPSAVQDFLPQEGRPAPLTASYIDPPSRWKLQHAKKQSHHRRLGSLAGETLALELNVRFSALALTRSGLGSLKLASGKLAGMTVDQVLAIANSVLGGNALPPALKTFDDLEDIVERINKNFQAGTTNNGYLIVP
jgi:hypothetical protein